MKEWIPFFQALVWPVFLAALLLIFRRKVLDVIGAVKGRIEAGAEMGVGPSGFTLGSAPVLKTETKTKGNIKRSQGGDRDYQSGVLYMVHSARFAKKVPEGRDYEITVRIYAENSEIEERIERVEYHLHRSYKRRIRESIDRNKDFELILYAWGQFNLKAHVYLSGESKPIVLWRFLNF